MTDTIKIHRYFITKIFPQRNDDSNKGTFGTVLNIAGSVYYPGASYLSSISALKSGCGLVRLATESSVIPIVASMSPDITFIDLGQNDIGTIPKNALKYLKNIKNPSAVSIGCGLSGFAPVREFVIKFLNNYIASSIPFIIDADAINILASIEDKPLPLNSVITPHPKELSRLLNVSVEEIQSDRINYAKKASEKFDCIVVLKGQNTVVSIPNGNTFINTTGNSALSHGGTGDILCGMIAGFSSQGMKLEDAAVLAVYLHGRAGELASKKLTKFSTLASDVLNYIPDATKEFT